MRCGLISREPRHLRTDAKTGTRKRYERVEDLVEDIEIDLSPVRFSREPREGGGHDAYICVCIVCTYYTCVATGT